MKKLIFIIVCLFCALSCNNHTGDSLNEIEILLAKEKRTQAQPKKHKGDEFGVYITSDRKDTRTADDITNNLPPQYEITNTVLFGHLGLYDGDLPYGVDFEIKKIIKENTGKISFTLSIRMLTKNFVRFGDRQLVQVKLNDDVTQGFDCNVEYLPAPEHLSSIFHIINCTSEVGIKDIHTMRLHSGDANVLITTAKNNFSFVLPKVFFTYLNEI